MQTMFEQTKMQMISTYLQILARRSPLPVAKSFPVGLGATEMTAMLSVVGAMRSAMSLVDNLGGMPCGMAFFEPQMALFNVEV